MIVYRSSSTTHPHLMQVHDIEMLDNYIMGRYLVNVAVPVQGEQDIYTMQPRICDVVLYKGDDIWKAWTRILEAWSSISIHFIDDENSLQEFIEASP